VSVQPWRNLLVTDVTTAGNRRHSHEMIVVSHGRDHVTTMLNLLRGQEATAATTTLTITMSSGMVEMSHHIENLETKTLAGLAVIGIDVMNIAVTLVVTRGHPDAMTDAMTT
jgi:methyl coenzyme M reductase beta subunit